MVGEEFTLITTVELEIEPVASSTTNLTVYVPGELKVKVFPGLVDSVKPELGVTEYE
jgi:hypothetical protein